jgi:hypothetical protein
VGTWPYAADEVGVAKRSHAAVFKALHEQVLLPMQNVSADELATFYKAYGVTPTATCRRCVARPCRRRSMLPRIRPAHQDGHPGASSSTASTWCVATASTTSCASLRR